MATRVAHISLVLCGTLLASAVFSAAGCGGGDSPTQPEQTTRKRDTALLEVGTCREPLDCTVAIAGGPSNPILAQYWKCNNHVCDCVSSSACPGSQLCNAYTAKCDPALTGCKSDAECTAQKPGTFCDLTTNQCASAGIPCQPCTVLEDGTPNDAQCGGSADRCIVYDPVTSLAYCGKGCSQDSECNTADVVGSALATCVGENCPYICLKGASADVAASGTAQANGQCQPRRNSCCVDDLDCPPGARCDATIRQCVPYCEADEDCPGEQKCCGNACVPDYYCDAACGCRDGKICNERKSECIDGCTNKAECPLGNLCDSTTKTCAPGCENILDCPPATSCENGQCQAGHCANSDFCPVVGQVCTQGTCQAATQQFCQQCGLFGCPGGVICLTDGTGALQFCADPPLPGNQCPKGYILLDYGLATGGTTSAYTCAPASNHCPP